MKEAIRDEIKRMKFEGEKVKVGVITFGSEVSVKKIKGKDVTIPSNLYYDFDAITKHASKIEGFDHPIQTHHKEF